MQFDYVAFLFDDDLSVLQRTSKGWNEIPPSSLPNDGGSGVCVLVGDPVISGLAASLPTGRDREVHRALPFAVEDEVAVELGDTHFAIGAKRPGQPRRQVRVVSKENMERWLSSLKQYKIPDAPIYFLADVFPQEAVLLEMNEIVYGRAQDRVFALEREMPVDLFAALVGDGDKEIYSEQLGEPLGARANGAGVTDPVNLLLQVSDWGLNPDAVNLRQNEFSTRRVLSNADWRVWRLTAALAVGLCLVWLANIFLDARSANRGAALLEAKANNVLATEFPDAGGNVSAVLSEYDPSRVQEAEALPSAIELVAMLYKATEAVEEAEVKSFRYDRRRGDAVTVVSVLNFESFDELAAQLRSSGLSVSASDARQEGARVVGELRLGAGS